MSIALDWFGRISIRDKMLIICLLVGSFIVIYVQFVLKAQRQELAFIKQQLEQKRLTFQIIENEINGQPDPEQYFAELQAQEQIVNMLLPTEEAMTDVLVMLNKLAKEQSVKIHTVKQGVYVNNKGYYEIPLDVSLTSTYKDLLLYINELEHLKRFATISKLTVTPENQLLNVQMTASVYVYGSCPQNAIGKTNK